MGCRLAGRASGDSRIYSFPLEVLVVWDHLPPHVTEELCEHAGWKTQQRSVCTSTHPAVHGVGRCALPASVHTQLPCTHTSAVLAFALLPGCWTIPEAFLRRDIFW